MSAYISLAGHSLHPVHLEATKRGERLFERRLWYVAWVHVGIQFVPFNFSIDQGINEQDWQEGESSEGECNH